jgi:hypothetical protein
VSCNNCKFLSHRPSSGGELQDEMDHFYSEKYINYCIHKLVRTASVVKWSEFLATDPEVPVRFPELPDFLRSSGSGTGSTQPREYN